jgi:hypothetical protein
MAMCARTRAGKQEALESVLLAAQRVVKEDRRWFLNADAAGTALSVFENGVRACVAPSGLFNDLKHVLGGILEPTFYQRIKKSVLTVVKIEVVRTKDVHHKSHVLYFGGLKAPPPPLAARACTAVAVASLSLCDTCARWRRRVQHT